VSHPLSEGLTRALARVGLPAPEGMERLSGGANMESWRFSAGDEVCVLRRAPSLEMMVGRPMDHAGEAALIRAARAAGVMAPEVLVELEPGDGIGSGYVMRSISGSPDPNAFLAEADPQVAIRDIARELAATHRVDCTGLPVPVMDTAQALGELRTRFMTYGGDRPILALALRWLEANIPPPVAPRLVHGDFRLGNLMFEHGRVTGVLDWELAHLGDWHEDLAFGCMTVWRFSRPDRPGYGLTTVAELARAYEEAGGERFDPERFRFWTIYRTFWWALGCLQMGGFWRAGHDRSVERVVVARRTAEQELDLLLLLEDLAPAAERSLSGRAAAGRLHRRRDQAAGEQDDNIRFFDHRREWARTDFENGGLPRHEWEGCCAKPPAAPTRPATGAFPRPRNMAARTAATCGWR
jgi:aminoglycoside phosphotransferase (APT) family kinase protein